MASVDTRAIEDEIDRLRSLGLEELRREWRRLNHGEPPRIISRPMLVVVLNCWVIDTKETPRRSKTSTSLAKSESARVSRFWPSSISAISLFRAGRSIVPPENPPSS